MKREFGPLPNVRLMRMFGFDAAQQIENNTLDFVYIDAVHTLPMVLADCCMWWPKLKKGGLLSGHDLSLGEMGVKGSGNYTPALQVSEALKTFLYLVHKPQCDVVPDDQSSWGIFKGL